MVAFKKPMPQAPHAVVIIGITLAQKKAFPTPSIAEKGSVDAEEEVYLNLNELAEGHDYFHMNGMTVSPDHHFVAWLADTDGGERFILHVKDLRSGTILESRIHDLKWSLAWAADSRTLFYCKSDAAQRPYKIFRWHIKHPTSSEVEVLHEPNERYFLTREYNTRPPVGAVGMPQQANVHRSRCGCQ